jgi:flagellar L-ring protein precursor FlgH
MRRLALVTLAAASAAACASTPDFGDMTQDTLAAPGIAFDAARRAAGPPQFAEVGTPAALTGGAQDTMPLPAQIAFQAPAANSLWRPGERSFFNDQRASRIGDILTVDIEIEDKAELSNSSNRTRSASTSAGVSNFFGLENAFGALFGSEFDPETLIEAQAESDHTGQGAINREEKIELRVAAVIVDRLANGNFIIAGRQQVRINSEMRELTVTGMIRPQDIAADNTIRHDQIAEARIQYGGRGQISAVQRPNIGQRIGDAISPY